VDDAHVLAEAMVIRSGEEREPHWNNMAANVMRGMLSLILSSVAEQDRHLLALRDMVTDFELCMACVAKMKEKGGVFARMAGVIEHLKSTEEGGRWCREGASIMSHINQHTTFMDSPAIVKNIAKSSFDAR
jgi:type IV secretion system protein VirD4